MTSRCLIIDQSAMVRRVAARIIRELGFEVIEAKSAREGLDMSSTTPPNVVMLDWKTPDMNGAEFIAAMRAQTGETAMPIILFCTADRSVDQIVTALKAGADEYIMKPFDSEIIESKFALAGLIDETAAACAAH